MNYKAAIFDLDGTLLDSMDVWKNIDKEFLGRRSIELPEDYPSTVCAMSFPEAAQYTIDRFGLDDEVEAIITEWKELADKAYFEQVELLPHVTEYLDKLKEKNIRLAVATGMTERIYTPCLKRLGIYDYFEVLCSTEEVGKSKDAPDVFRLVAERLGEEPTDCVVFDDVLPAIRSAKQIGMSAYGIYDKYSAHHEDQIRELADGYLYDLKDAPV